MAGKGHTTVGTTHADIHPPPSPELCRARSCFLAFFLPKHLFSWHIHTGASAFISALPGARNQPWPGCHTWCWATSVAMSRGTELLVCFGRQQWVVSEGMGCDTGDCPVFPCGVRQRQGEDSCPTRCLRIGGRM